MTSLLQFRDQVLSASADKAGVIQLWGMTPQMRLQHTINLDAGVAALGIFRDALFAASGKRIATFEFGSKANAPNMVPIQDKMWKGQISTFGIMQCHHVLLLGSDDGSIKTCR